MDVKTEYHPPVIEQRPRRSFLDIVILILKFFFYPLKFMRDKLKIVQEDTNKKRLFEVWLRKENVRYRRGNKLNDEF